MTQRRLVYSRHTLRSLSLALVIGVLLGPEVAAEPQTYVDARLQADLEVVKTFRPAYPFWQHIFTIPDGRIAFGSEQDGRLLVTFPTKGNWSHDAEWEDPGLAAYLAGTAFPTRLDDRRDLVVSKPRACARAARAQPHSRAVPDAERAALRTVPAGVESHLRTLRRARRGRPVAGDSRIGSERHRPITRECAGAVPVVETQLAVPRQLVASGHRGLQPDDAGAVLRGLPVDPGHHVRQFHPSALRASLGGRERGPHGDQRRAPGRRHRERAVSARVEVRPRFARRGSARLPRPLPDLRSALVPLRRDGVRQHRQREADPERGAAATRLCDACAATHPGWRDHQAHPSDGRRSPTFQSRAHAAGAGQWHCLSSDARTGVRR